MRTLPSSRTPTEHLPEALHEKCHSFQKYVNGNLFALFLIYHRLACKHITYHKHSFQLAKTFWYWYPCSQNFKGAT